MNRVRKAGRPTSETKTRDALLEQAQHLFTSMPYEKVSTRMLAEKAGVNPAMIRYYFGSKEGLFEAMIMHVMAPILTHARTKYPSSDSSTLVGMLKVHFEVMSQDLAFPRLLFRVLGMPPSEVQRRLTDKMFEQMVGNVNERLFDNSKGIVRDGLDPQKCKLNILSLMLFPFIAPNALLEKHGIEINPEFLNELFAHNIDVMFNGILQQPADKTSLTNED